MQLKGITYLVLFMLVIIACFNLTRKKFCVISHAIQMCTNEIYKIIAVWFN